MLSHIGKLIMSTNMESFKVLIQKNPYGMSKYGKTSKVYFSAVQTHTY